MKKSLYPIAGEILLLPIGAILSNNRGNEMLHSHERQLELVDSIRQHGMLEPLLVRMIQSDVYDIVSGERRYEAAVAAGLTEIPCILLLCGETESSLLRLTVRQHDLPMHFLEEAEMIGALMEEGFSAADAAQMMDKPLRYVTDKRKLLSLPEPLRDTIIRHNIPEEIALLLADAPQDRQEALLHQYTEAYLSAEAFHQLIHNGQQKESRQAKIVIFKDVTVFTNTVERAVSTMRKAGIHAESVKTENDEIIEYRITIPKDAVKEPHTNIG